MKIVALVALLILFLTPTVASSENDRHTPGFPAILVNELFDDLVLDSRLLNILRSVAESAIAGKLTDEELANAMIRVLNSDASEKDIVASLNVLSKFHSLSKVGNPISPDTLYELIRNTKDENLFNDLMALFEKYTAGLTTPQDIESLINKIKTDYASAGTNLVDLLVATEASQLIGRSIGYSDVGSLVNQATEILLRGKFSNLELETIDEVTKFLETLNPISTATESLDLFIPNLGDVGWVTPGTPSIGLLPVFSVGFPRVDLSLIAYVAIPVAIVLLCIFLVKVIRISGKLSKALSRLVYLRGSPVPNMLTNLAGLRIAIRNYWVAVKFLESRYGIARYPWETHWEYLSRISINRKKAFEGLTQTYELAKYAQDESKDLDEKSELYLKELIGGGQ
ncbi:MAG: DUF4129 domain-containing protein [Ignisphaera sp.]